MRNPLRSFVDGLIDKRLEKVAESNIKVRALLDRTGYIDNDSQFSPENREDYLVAYERYVWVYAAVYAIASSGGKVPFRIYQLDKSQKRGEEILDGRLWNLFNRPNPLQSYYDLMEAALSSMELAGGAYFEKGGANPQEAEQLYLLRPDWVEIIPSAKTLIGGYKYKVNGTVINFTSEQVCYAKYYAPRTELYGQSPIGPSTQSMILDFYTMKYQKNFFKQGAMMNTYVTVPKALGDKEFQRLKEQLRSDYSGVDRSHMIGLFDNDAQLKELGVDPQKFLLSEQRATNRDEVLATFGVPPVMVGLLDSATFNNTAEQKKAFWENTMTPKLQKLQDKFNQEFLWPMNCEGEFDLKQVPALQEDSEKKARTASAVVSGGIYTPNEARKEFYNLPEVKGGDELKPVAPVMAGAYPPSSPGIPASSTDASAAPIAPAAAPADAGVVATTTLNGAQITAALDVVTKYGAKELSRSAALELLVAVGIQRAGAERMVEEAVAPAPAVAPAVAPASTPAPAPAKKVDRAKALEKAKADAKVETAAIEQDYYAAMKSIFKAMSDKAAAQARKSISIKKSGVLRKDGLINDVVNSLDAETQHMIDELALLHEETEYDTAMRNYVKVSGVPAPRNVRDSARASAKANAASWAKASSDSIVKTMQDRTAGFLDGAVAEDMDIDDVVSGIQDIFEGTDREEYPWARAIARTETQKAINTGKMDAFKAAGIEWKEWIAADGPNGREEHTALGELGPVPIDYVYKTSMSEMQYPGDPDADVSDLVNCRCVITESLAGPDTEADEEA